MLKKAMESRHRAEIYFKLLSHLYRLELIEEIEKAVEEKILKGEKLLYLSITNNNRESYWYYWSKSFAERRRLKKYLKAYGYKAKFKMGTEFDAYDSYRIKW